MKPKSLTIWLFIEPSSSISLGAARRGALVGDHQQQRRAG